MQNIYQRFRGAGVALVTPFQSNGAIDEKALEKLIAHIEDGGADYLLALGTTAETVTMDFEERRKVASLIRKFNKKSLPLMIGVGGNCTADLVRRIGDSDFSGYDAILSVTPYYNKPSQSGLFHHFSAVAEASPIPIFLYNVPGRTGVNLLPETVIALAEKYPGKIIGIKEASGKPEQTAAIHKALKDDFTILSGDDNKTPELIRNGACGVISVSINAFPRQVKTMTDALLKGDNDTADKIYRQLYNVTELLFKEGNPVGIKALLSIMGILDNNLRLPLVPASEQLTRQIEEQIRKDGLC